MSILTECHFRLPGPLNIRFVEFFTNKDLYLVHLDLCCHLRFSYYFLWVVLVIWYKSYNFKKEIFISSVYILSCIALAPMVKEILNGCRVFYYTNMYTKPQDNILPLSD